MKSEILHPHWAWWVAILTGMTLTGWIAFSSAGFSLWSHWFTNLIPQQGFQWIFWVALGLHILEGSYAFWLARKIQHPHPLGWGLQTFTLGYPSLRLLLSLHRED